MIFIQLFLSSNSLNRSKKRPCSGHTLSDLHNHAFLQTWNSPSIIFIFDAPYLRYNFQIMSLIHSRICHNWVWAQLFMSCYIKNASRFLSSQSRICKSWWLNFHHIFAIMPITMNGNVYGIVCSDKMANSFKF